MLVKIIKKGLFAENYKTVHNLEINQELEVENTFGERLIETGYAEAKVEVLEEVKTEAKKAKAKEPEAEAKK